MSSPCTAIFISVTRLDEDDVRDIGIHDFRSVLSHAMLSNVNHLAWVARSMVSANQR